MRITLVGSLLGLAVAIVLVGSCGSDSDVANADVAALEQRLAECESLLRHFSIDGNDIYITGANVHVVNGLDDTETVNGLGNVIIGHNEERGGGEDDRTGSHMLVVGSRHNYSSYGGVVVGSTNTASAQYASVSGGAYNTASGYSASVSGGSNNTAGAQYASVSGGLANTASGSQSSVSGGASNSASEYLASVSGGAENVAAGQVSSINGGRGIIASSDYEHPDTHTP